MEIRWDIIEQLLLDRTRSMEMTHNIIWATGDQPITEITEADTHGIVPRCRKPKEVQRGRTKSKAEVFTPVWIVNQMVNHADAVWFDRENVFNTPSEDGKSWTPTDRVDFGEKDWRDYVTSNRLEITCGEGAFLTTRYDNATGESIPIERRVGMLDRKLRVVSENCHNYCSWYKWACKALETTYGYEYQGDSLYLARRNVLEAVIEACEAKWGEGLTIEQMDTLVGIITWNVWQMDGLTDCVPLTDIPARILDRETHRVIEFRSLKGDDAQCTKKPKFRTKSV